MSNTLTLSPRPSLHPALAAAPTATLAFKTPSTPPEMDALLAELGQRFPKAFRYGRALAIGTYGELRKLGYPSRLLYLTLQRWTTGAVYLRTVERGGSRRNLDGSVAGPISPEHQAFATAALATAIKAAKCKQKRIKPVPAPAAPAVVVVMRKSRGQPQMIDLTRAGAAA